MARHPGGAPRKYDRMACMLKIRDAMAKGDRGLIDICAQDPTLPEHSTVYLWVAEDPELFDIFTRAQELWCWAQKDLIIKISDDDSRDVIENVTESTTEDGETVTKVERRSDNTAVNRDKLRVGARQWAMQRLLNKVFGDKIQTEQKITVETEYVDRPEREDYETWKKRVEERAKQEKAKRDLAN